jgi:hypothetical protein
MGLSILPVMRCKDYRAGKLTAASAGMFMPTVDSHIAAVSCIRYL